MIGQLLGVAAAVVGGLLVADTVSKAMTGKHLHEHVFAWWRSLHDMLTQWVHANPHIHITRYIGVLSAADNMATNIYNSIKKVFAVGVVDEQGNVYELSEHEVSEEDAEALFSGAASQAVDRGKQVIFDLEPTLNGQEPMVLEMVDGAGTQPPPSTRLDTPLSAATFCSSCGCKKTKSLRKTACSCGCHARS